MNLLHDCSEIPRVFKEKRIVCCLQFLKTPRSALVTKAHSSAAPSLASPRADPQVKQPLTCIVRLTSFICVTTPVQRIQGIAFTTRQPHHKQRLQHNTNSCTTARQPAPPGLYLPPPPLHPLHARTPAPLNTPATQLRDGPETKA